MTLKKLFEKTKSVLIAENADGGVMITVNRKSRFIRKDAEKLLEKIHISMINPEKITIKFNAPLCGKAKLFLESHKITVNE